LSSDCEAATFFPLHPYPRSKFIPRTPLYAVMTCDRHRQHRELSQHSCTPAFLEQILPGLCAGVASSLTFYPLELYETTLQASASASVSSNTPPAQWTTGPARRSPSTVTPPRRLRPIQNQAPFPTPIAALTCAYAEHGLHGVFRGADMALASAVVGFATFFTTVAVADAVAPSAALIPLLAKNVLPAPQNRFSNLLVTDGFCLRSDNQQRL
jgi:hypothetical protein